MRQCGSTVGIVPYRHLAVYTIDHRLSPDLKQTLQNLFKSYQVIPPVIAHGNLRMRGQAFVSFPDKETADKARREVAGFPLYGKPMVSLSRRTTRKD
jgi:U2 small nuclear ribonucleoprotein B''